MRTLHKLQRKTGRRIAGLLLSAGVSLAAHADRLPLPADTPTAYREECGSCHLAFPPALLDAGSWQRTMAELGRHFGTDASVTPAQQESIRQFLLRRAGSPQRLGTAADTGAPPRLTQTPWFRREHREVPGALWKDKRVNSAANCEACHAGAAQGRYSEHDLALPELRGR